MRHDVTMGADTHMSQDELSAELSRRISGSTRRLLDHLQRNFSLNVQRGLLLIFILLQVLFFAGYLALQHERIEEDATRILRNTALLEAQQFETSMDAMRYQVRVIGNAILLNRTIPLENSTPFLDHELKRDWLDGVIILNATGDVIAKRTLLSPDRDFYVPKHAHELPLFQDLRQESVKDRQFYLQDDGFRGFVIYRAVYDPQGRYLGGAIGYFHTITLTKLFLKMENKGFDLGYEGAMAVFERGTGLQLARMGSGMAAHESGSFGAIDITDSATVRDYVSPIDGVHRLGVFLGLNERKWMLTVGFAKTEIFFDWYCQAATIFLGLIVMATLQWLLLQYARVNYLQRERFASEARRDPLTELANRRYFDEWAQGACSLARRHQQPLCVLTLDLDFFKNINDRYGHDGGDVVLKQVSHVLRDALRVSDVAARFGGEEFVVAMPQTELEMAGKVAERIRVHLAAQELAFKDQVIRFTASFGLAQMTPEELEISDGIHAALARADEALYRSKQGGRNRVTLANEA